MIADDDILGRARGCWLGQLVGDALGSMVEFQTAASIGRRYPNGLREIGPSDVWGTLAGQPTDDSEMALGLARSLVRDGTYDDEAVAAAYLAWYDSPPFDIGNTTRQAMQAMADARRDGISPAEGARRHANPDSEANGALMRQSPLAIWGHALPVEVLADAVRRDTTLTHPNRVCVDASCAVILPVAKILREGLDVETAYALACQWDAMYRASPTVTDALKAARETPPDHGYHAGHVLVALQNAWYQALHAPSFEAGIVATVMGGGDTDTNAAIAGALLGALHGGGAIPAQWRDAVLSCRPSADVPGIRHPRPETYWPTDARDLAAALLAAAPR